MNLIRETLTQYSREYLNKLADEYEQFERDGFIGECDLRTEAATMFPTAGGIGVVQVMNMVAFETYRILAGR